MKSIQYTIREVNPEVDRVLREEARRSGRSLNTVLQETLRRGAGLGQEAVVNRDFDDLAGRWVKDKGCEGALEAMRAEIDEELWK